MRDFEKQQQLKWEAYVIKTENNAGFPQQPEKSLGRKLSSILKPIRWLWKSIFT